MIFKKYIFIDSKSKGAVDQFVFIFDNKLCDPSEIEVKVKFRWSNFYQHFISARRYGYNLKFHTRINENILGSSGVEGFVLYFFNSIENVKLLKNRNFHHVFIGHGESNKRASLHPLYRIYDRLLVSGEFAKKRLVENNIICESDPRVFDIAGNGVAEIDFSSFNIYYNNNYHCDDRFIMYMPTWEGGVDFENYSSLSNNSINVFLVGMLERLNINNIIIYPHPNIGFRDRKYFIFLKKLLTSLVRKGYVVAIPKKRDNLNLKMDIPKVHTFTSALRPNEIYYSFVDVSAAESMAAKKNIPSVVLINGNNLISAPSNYLRIKKKFMFELSSFDERSLDDLVFLIDNSSQNEYTKNFQTIKDVNLYRLLKENPI